jgi:hypothetical protein
MTMACKINPSLSLSLLKGNGFTIVVGQQNKNIQPFVLGFSLDKTRGTMHVVLCTCRAQKGHRKTSLDKACYGYFVAIFCFWIKIFA